MTETIDHETCSTRLREFVAGELDRAGADEVERHLATCTACERERQAVAWLTGLEPDPMTEAERTRLRATVAQAKRADATRTAAHSTWRARLAPALAAAAAVVIVAVAATSVFTVGTGGSGAEGGGGQGAASVEDQNESAEVAGPRPRRLEAQALPQPRFDNSIGALSSARLRRIVRRSPFRAAATASATEDVGILRARLGARLAEQAPPEAAGQVRACTEAVVAQDASVVPVYAATATLDGDEVLVVGFLRSPSSTGPPGAYQLWVWPLGSCETPLRFRSGRIRG